ncbi:hypothetical protein EMCRGX_G012444 [Ephydatia muelleri]
MTDACNIKVVCRVRPLNSKEQASGNTSAVKFPAQNAVEVGNRVFYFDCVLQPTCTQVQVYNEAACALVKDVLAGYNATIFAYGQTSSGKTHTMEGVLNDSGLKGIIPRIIENVFEHIYEMDDTLEIHIKVSYFEIYMEKIRDLLDTSRGNLQIGETKNKVPYVKGISERFVTSPDEVMAVLEEGKYNRHVSATSMNADSSRSHAIFLLQIKQENRETRKTLMGKLYLVDLAGSEKVDKTDAQGLTLDEAKTINKSLLTLSNVISALAEGKPFIPYRESKLTRVLQESLGGNARTTLIVCCSPSVSNAAETKSTLMFGDRAKAIKNKVEVNVELTAEEWKRRFEKEREGHLKAKAALERLECEVAKWRLGQFVAEKDRAVKDGATPDVSIPASGAGPQASTVLLRTESSDWEAEKLKLCQQLDEREEEIHTQSNIVEALTIRVQDQEEALAAAQLDSAELKTQISAVEQELVNSQAEVREVMQALEELALSYDIKDKDIEAMKEERHTLLQQVEQLHNLSERKAKELNDLQESFQLDRRKNREMVSALLRDVLEVSSVLGGKSGDKPRPQDGGHEITDDDLTRARVHLSNLSCEARTLWEQRDLLERGEREAREGAESALRDLAHTRAKLSQFELQNDGLRNSLQEAGARRQQLEESLNSVNQQLSSLRLEEQSLLTSGHQPSLPHFARESGEEVLQALRESVLSKEWELTSLSKQYEDQTVAMEMVKNELKSLEQAHFQEREQYTLFKAQLQIKEKAQQEIGGIANIVASEMERLNQLRQSFLLRIVQKVAKVNAADVDAAPLSPTKREVEFLEKNLEELSRAHMQITAENTNMHREIPKLQATLASKGKRIGELEHLLRETKEAANKEYMKLKEDMEQMRESFMERLKETRERGCRSPQVIRRQGPILAKPVPRVKGVETTPPSTSARDALLAGAGVSVIGQTKRSPYLSRQEMSASALSSSEAKHS